MTEYAQQRRLWTGLTLAVLALAALASLMTLRSAAATRARVDAWVASKKQGIDASTDSRQVVWGEGEPGDAMPFYAAALQESVQLAADDALLSVASGAEAAVGDAPDAQAMAALRQRWQSALAGMHAGALRAELRMPTDWWRGFEQPPIDAIAAMRLGRAAAAQARALLRAGDRGAACEMLLDLLAFGADLGQLPEMVSAMVGGCMGGLVAQVLTEDELRQLDADTLRRIADAILRVQAGWAGISRQLTGEAVMLAHSGFRSTGFSLLAWRNGFSGSAMCGEALEQLSAGIDAIAAAESMPWPQRRLELVRVQQQWRVSANQMTRAAATDVAGIETRLRAERAKLLLLRMAALFHAGDPVPQTPDPLGSGMLSDMPTPAGRQFASEGLGSTEVLRRLVQR